MPVTPEQAALLRSGFEELSHRLEPASVAFYEALFRRRPDFRRMFRDDLAGQGMQFMSTLAAVVDSLDVPADLAGALARLGHSHATLGVAAADFAPMGEALIEVLRAELGPAFSAEAEAAWRLAYADLAQAMIAGGIS